MTEKYSLEELSRMTGASMEMLRRAVKEGTLDAKPHRTYVVRVESREEAMSLALGAIARLTSPSDSLEL